MSLNPQPQTLNPEASTLNPEPGLKAKRETFSCLKGCGMEGLRTWLRVQVFGKRVGPDSLGFRGSGFRVQGLGFRV